MTDTTETLDVVGAIYAEAFDLAREAQDYLANQAPRERAEIPLSARVLVNEEASRLTSRLAEVLAWILIQRAIDAGELTRAEASMPRNRISGQEFCGEVSETVGKGAFSPRFESLLDRSLSLYRRVVRLDDMLSGAA